MEGASHPDLSRLNLALREDVSGGYGRVFKDVDFQQQLVKRGYVVVPTPLGSDPDMLARFQDDFDQHFRESPELCAPRPEDPEWRSCLGGFAAVGNPSSFHHPFVRKMREMCAATMLDNDVLPINGRLLEQCFDRIMRRIPGSMAGKDSWHRDESVNTVKGDDIFGGWINFDDQPQYFSCAPGSHTEVGTQNNGFAKLQDEDEVAWYQSVADVHGQVMIPPGHILVFYERLVHEVVNQKATRIMKRLFLGWRVTMSPEPLFGIDQTTQWVKEQGVPRIKSGQASRTWPGILGSNTPGMESIRTFSANIYQPQCHEEFLIGGKGTKFAGETHLRVRGSMRSLAAYKLPMHAEYHPAEFALLLPQRTWELFTFDSPIKRLRFKAVPLASRQLRIVNAQGLPTRRTRPSRI